MTRPYDPKAHWDFMQERVERAQHRQGTRLRYRLDREEAQEREAEEAAIQLAEALDPVARAERVRVAEIDGVYCEHVIKPGVLNMGPPVTWATPPVYCGRQLSGHHVDSPYCDKHDPDALSSDDEEKAARAVERDLRLGLRASRSWDDARAGDDSAADGD